MLFSITIHCRFFLSFVCIYLLELFRWTLSLTILIWSAYVLMVNWYTIHFVLIDVSLNDELIHRPSWFGRRVFQWCIELPTVVIWLAHVPMTKWSTNHLVWAGACFDNGIIHQLMWGVLGLWFMLWPWEVDFCLCDFDWLLLGICVYIHSEEGEPCMLVVCNMVYQWMYYMFAYLSCCVPLNTLFSALPISLVMRIQYFAKGLKNMDFFCVFLVIFAASYCIKQNCTCDHYSWLILRECHFKSLENWHG